MILHTIFEYNLICYYNYCEQFHDHLTCTNFLTRIYSLSYWKVNFLTNPSSSGVLPYPICTEDQPLLLHLIPRPDRISIVVHHTINFPQLATVIWVCICKCCWAPPRTTTTIHNHRQRVFPPSAYSVDTCTQTHTHTPEIFLSRYLPCNAYLHKFFTNGGQRSLPIDSVVDCRT